MSLWSKVKKAAKKAAKAVKKAADAVQDVVNDVGDAIGDGVEAAGDAINDALNWAGDKVGGKGIFSWLGGIIKGVFGLAGVAIKGVFGIIGGFVSGVMKIIGGIFTGHGKLILEGLWDIFSPILGTIIVVVGKAIALIQSVFYGQGFERKLTEKEISQLKRAFKNSLNYYVIRIIEGHAGIFGLNSRPFTLGNTIYMKSSSFDIELLVHETTHVWQYQQRGDRYASDAIAAQWFVPDEYSWQREIDVRGKGNWSNFNNEAQAEFFEDLWKIGELKDSSGVLVQKGNGSFFVADHSKTFEFFEANGKDYTSIAVEAVKTVQTEWF